MADTWWGRKAVGGILVAATIVAVTGCASSPPSLVGMWEPDDGSGIKTVSSSGSCSGMYYNGKEPLDIGGPMSCALGDKETGGTYTLVVTQPPNKQTYLVKFDGEDTAVLMDASGATIVTLTRR